MLLHVIFIQRIDGTTFTPIDTFHPRGLHLTCRKPHLNIYNVATYFKFRIISGLKQMNFCIVYHLVLLDCLLSLCDSFSTAFLVQGKLINSSKSFLIVISAIVKLSWTHNFFCFFLEGYLCRSFSFSFFLAQI